MRGRASLKRRLFDAIGRRDPNEVRTWLDAGADPNARDRDAYTPLGYAVECGVAEIVELLLARGADPDHAMMTMPLHHAIKYDDKATTQVLIRAGADVNQRDDFNITPLMLAAANGDEELVRQLLKIGADASVEDKNGRTAVTLAKRAGREDLAAVLKEHGGTDPDDLNPPEILKRQDRFVEAARQGNVAEVKRLLAEGAYIDGNPNQKEITAMEEAAGCNHLDVIRALLEAGGSPNAGGVWPPVGEAAALEANDAVKILIEAGADVNAPNVDGDTPLMAAAQRGNLEAAELLINAGADVHAESRYGRTPLAMAYDREWRYGRRNPIVDLLLRLGATNLGAYHDKFKEFQRPTDEASQ
jgi:ankyrin repeat protein